MSNKLIIDARGQSGSASVGFDFGCLPNPYASVFIIGSPATKDISIKIESSPDPLAAGIERPKYQIDVVFNPWSGECRIYSGGRYRDKSYADESSLIIPRTFYGMPVSKNRKRR